MDTLTKLLGNATKVKVVKQFLFNPDTPFDVAQIAERTKESRSKVRREINLLEKMRLIKHRVFFKPISRKVRGKTIISRVKVNGWLLDENFEFLIPLHNFMVSLNDLSPKELIRKFSRGGVMKLIILAGLFIQNPESRLDLLIVGDHLKVGTIESAIKVVESEIGEEIRYAVFETADYKYRLGLYDKLIRDVLDFPHETILDKLGTV